METIIIAVLGMGVGIAIGYLAASLRGAHQLATQREAAENLRLTLKEREATLEARQAASEQQRETFKSLAAEALKENKDDFLQLAGLKLDPLRSTVTSYAEATVRLEGRINVLEDGIKAVASAAGSLETALKGSSQARGQWGEMQLRNIVELAGMAEHCDFEEQENTESGNRPDMMVRLPGGDVIPVDAKVSCDAYLDALEADDDAARAGLLEQHARNVVIHVKKLASKDYASDIKGRVDFTVMHLNGEQFLGAAAMENRTLIEDAIRNRILITTPVTLVALLRTVAVYWREHAMAENARKVWKEASELHKRAVAFGRHLGGLRSGLATAVDSYNEAVGSYLRRLLPQGRKVESLDVAETAVQPLEELEPISEPLRELPDKAVGE